MGYAKIIVIKSGGGLKRDLCVHQTEQKLTSLLVLPSSLTESTNSFMDGKGQQ